MSFILFVAAGFAAGVLGGMGMGGGTILIPALTLLFGVSQHVAQAANVIAFLPMSLFALGRHKKQGLLRTQGLYKVIIPALVFAAVFAVLMLYLPGEMLRKLFAVFLIILAVKQLFALRSSLSNNAKNRQTE